MMGGVWDRYLSHDPWCELNEDTNYILNVTLAYTLLRINAPDE